MPHVQEALMLYSTYLIMMHFVSHGLSLIPSLFTKQHKSVYDLFGNDEGSLVATRNHSCLLTAFEQ